MKLKVLNLIKEIQIAKNCLKKSKEDAELKKQEKVLLFIERLEAYLTYYEDFMEGLGGISIPVSSEVIESLFGTYKSLASLGKLVGTTNLNLEIGVRCMQKQDIDMKTKEALETILMTDLKEWKDKHSSENQVLKRKQFFKNRK